MRLEITAFKGLKNRTIELPDRGLVRIAGDSEAGKSTVLSAIAWALFGDDSERSVNPVGETKAGVLLSGISNLGTVARFKGPGKLVVNDSLENDVAQAEILRQLGMSCEQFSASSYVKQKLKGSLLSLGASDQIRFIQSLAFGAHDPEKYRRSIQDSLSQRTGLLNSKSMVLVQAEDNYRKAQEHLASLAYPDLIEGANVAEINQMIAEETKTLESLKQQLETTRGLLHHPSRKFEPLIASLEQEIEAMQVWIDTQNNPASFLAISDALKRDQDTSARLENDFQKQQLHTEHSKRLTELTSNGLPPSKEEAGKAVESADRALSQIRQAIAHLHADKITTNNALKASYECPTCNSPLSLIEGKLHTGHDSVSKDALFAKLAWIDEEELKQKHLIVEWDKYRLFCQTQKQNFDKVLYDLSLLGEVSTEDLVPHLQELSNRINLLNTEKQQLQLELGKVQSVKTDLQAKQNSLNKLLENTVKDLPSEESLSRSVAFLEEEVKETSLDLMTRYGELQESSDINARLEQIKTLRSSYEKALTYCQSIKADSDITKQDVEKTTVELKAVSDLKKMSDEAVLSAVGGVVNSINSHLKQYVDIVFPDGGTQIYLMNESFTKKDERRAKMGLKIIHRGLEMSLDDFSGGAENRATLATQLAISDLFGSPILMLDEALTGSHPDLRDSILDHLRTVGQSKLVLVVEHGVSDSLFDDVIYL